VQEIANSIAEEEEFASSARSSGNHLLLESSLSDKSVQEVIQSGEYYQDESSVSKLYATLFYYDNFFK
jgi:hypothetical protein